MNHPIPETDPPDVPIVGAGLSAVALKERCPGQHFWPADLDYNGQCVTVTGSAATAVTLVPAMTDRAAHGTILQRLLTLRFGPIGEGVMRFGARGVLS